MGTKLTAKSRWEQNEGVVKMGTHGNTTGDVIKMGKHENTTGDVIKMGTHGNKIHGIIKIGTQENVNVGKCHSRTITLFFILCSLFTK